MNFVNSKLHKRQFILGRYWRFLFITTRVEIHSPKIFCILYIISKSSTSVNRKALKLDNKVKAINHCDVGKSCLAVGEEMGVSRTQIMSILKRKCEILDDFENNVSSSTSCYWKLYFCLLNIFIYLFVYFIQIISY
jgi:hypothetical protein